MKRNHIHIFFVALLVASMLLMGLAGSASAQTVSEVQAAIKAQGAFWVAGDNPISRLTPAQQKQLLGVVNPPRSATAPAAPTCQPSAVGLPVSLDWRNNGGNYVTSVKNQGGCGSCWAFSAIATLESATMIYNKTPNTSLDLSEQVLISCCDSTCSPAGQCGGGWPSKAADFLRDNGAPTDSCYTYVGSGSCGSACANWKASAYKIKNWEWIVNYDTSENPTVDKIKAGLQNGPLSISFAVYNDFFSYTSGVYKHVSGGLAGYHAVLVVGYDDAGQYFIVKNSWAATWGEQGYFKIAYSEVAGDSKFGYMTLLYHVGDAPNPTCEYPMSEYFTAAGGSANVQVATNSGCNWSASSNASWITITSGSTGSGPGVVAYTIAPNTASSRRTGTMTVPGGTYTVLQESGSGQCTYSLSPTSNSFTAAAGTGSFNVTAGSGCSWTAASNNTSWLTVTSGSSGTGNGSVNYSVTANTTSASRSATINVANKTFTVTQAAGSSCTYAISPTSVGPVPSVGYNGTVAVTAGSGCAWTATTNTSWVTVTSGSSGSGNGTVSYSVAPNTDGTQRTGTITIGGQTFTVSQSIGCSWSINPSSRSFTSVAGTGTIAVNAGTACAWSATSSAPSWLTVTSGGNGPGNGTVNYSVTANTGAARTGTITGIGGLTHTVTQAAGSSCTYAISPTSASFGTAAGTGSVSVTAGSGCAWTAVSNNTSWLTVTGGSSGSGNGTVGYLAAANASTTSRTGTLTIGGQTFTVTQAGTSCAYSLTPMSHDFGAPGGTFTVNITTSAECPWALAAQYPWITLTSATSGKGNATATYSVAANSGASRSGVIFLNALPFVGNHLVTQAAGSSCTYAISPTSVGPVPSVGYNGTVAVTAGSGCAWTATTNTSWVTVTSGSSGSGNGTVSYSVAPNTDGTQRTGTITIGGQTFTVSQSIGCSWSINPSSRSFTSVAGTGTIAVNAGTACAWSATSSAPSWLTVTSGGNGPGNGTVNYSVTANTGAARTGTITGIGGLTHTVTQAAGSSCTYAISPTSASFGTAAGTGSVSVTAGSGCAWTAVSNNTSWLTVTGGSSGSGNGTVGYLAAANASTTSRTGTLTIGGQTFTVTQAGTSCAYSLTPMSHDFGAPGGTFTVNITTSAECPWALAAQYPWITLTSATSGKGNATATYSVAANSGASRSGVIFLNALPFVGNHLVTQAAGSSCTYAISPTSVGPVPSVGYNGTVAVTAGSGCAWTATTNTSWVTVTSGSSGSGNGTVSYSVAPNTDGTQRTGTITIGGQTFTVSQSIGCSWSINPSSRSFTSVAGTGTIAVNAGTACAWSATSSAPSWLTVTSGGNGPGNGTVNYSVTANTGAARTGTITGIGGLTHTVTQTGGNTYTITPTTQSFPSSSGTGSVSVAAPSGTSWTASSNAAWLTVTSGANGKGNGAVTYSIAANTTTTSRSGSLTVAGQTFTATQAAGSSCTYSISPTSMGPVPSVGYNGNVTVTSGSGCAWTAKSNTSWVTVTSGASGSGNGTVSYSVAPNTDGTQRTGTITIAGQTFTVSQSIGCSWGISPSTQSFSSAAATGTISVTAGTSCAWTATSNASWITVTSGTSGTGNGTVTYAVQANNTGAARTGTITGWFGLTFTVTQAAGNTSSCQVSANVSGYNLPYLARQMSVAISAANTCSWSASSNVPWITVYSATGTGNGTLAFAVSDNPGAARTGTIKINQVSLTISQTAVGR